MTLSIKPTFPAKVKVKSFIFYNIIFFSFYSQQRGFKAPEFSLRIFKTMYFLTNTFELSTLA